MINRDDRMEQQQMRDEYHEMEERVAAAEDERDRLREVLQLLYDTSDATPGTASWEDYELAIHRAEQALKGVAG